MRVCLHLMLLIVMKVFISCFHVIVNHLEYLLQVCRGIVFVMQQLMYLMEKNSIFKPCFLTCLHVILDVRDISGVKKFWHEEILA